MKRSASFCKGVTVLLALTLVMAGLSGCFKKEDPQKELTEYSEEVTENFFDKLKASIKYNSSRDVEFPELTEEQIELMEYAFSGTDVKLGDVEIDDDDDEKGTVEYVFSGYKSYSDDLTKIATMDEYKAIVDDIKSEKVTVRLKAIKENDEWIFKDMSEIEEMFFEPYEELCFLDENGNPINITDAYSEYIAGMYGDIYISSYWYDPILGNPLMGSSISSPVSLQNVFYFPEPVSGEFTAQLESNGNVVATIDISIDNEVTIMCDFPAPSGGYTAGGYMVTLMIGSVPLAASQTITVN